MSRIKHVVYEKREGLRWWFVNTEKPSERYFLSLNPIDVKWLILNGIYLLVPPFKTSHIRGIWD